jgi:FHA domain
MARCPAGHESEASDYCDTCGLVIGAESAGTSVSAVAAPPIPAAAVPGPGLPAAAAPASGGGCPVCHAERNGRFCEECGYDFELAEAMPEITMTPGVAPAEPAAGGNGSASAAQGLDLDAELARAEAAAAASPPAPESEPAPTSAPEPQPSTPETSTTETSTATEPESESESESGSELPAPDPEAEAGAEAAISLASVLSPASTSPLTAELTLVVNADRDYYKAQIERGDIIESEFPFPKYPHERRFTFAQSPIRIGRASASRGIAPEIDLTGPPLDPAVSHLHAQLIRHDEGWVVVDLGSANGTRLNDAEEPLEAETEIPVHRGDRVHLGVWTTITLQ